MTKVRKPFGTWPSPVSAAVLSEATPIAEAAWSRDGSWLVWLEEHSGTGVLFASTLDGGDARRITGEESVRATIGYGGGNFCTGTERVFFVQRNGQIYSRDLTEGPARPLTPPGTLCASPTLSPDGKWLLYVYEQEGAAGLAIVDADGRDWPQKLTKGRDFYMHPTWHPAGNAVAWVAWDHPNMPWDGSRLYAAPVVEGNGSLRLGEAPTALAGGEAESVLQPEFSPDGTRLCYISDRGGWYRLYCRGYPQAGDELCLTPDEREYGGAAWQQGMRWYDWLPGGERIVVAVNREGGVSLALVDARSGGATPVDLPPYTTLIRPMAHPADGRIAALAAGDAVPSRLIVLELEAEPPAPRIVRRSASEQVPAEDLAEIRYVSWPGGDGETVHGLFAAPASGHYEDEGLPPLIVQVHGGPTGQAYRSWRPDVQFFTSRGYAFLDVNHRGSTGYGRAYRERLREQWGVMDVEDAISGLRYVTGQGWADGRRCAIKGGSAGGYTVLRALTVHPEAFKAGVCFYGISELFALARETHKFEAHYLDSLIGTLPEHAERYRERSPIHAAERIAAPLIIFQGGEDKVVPPSQSERIAASLEARGVPHEYHLYPGEGHGFRSSENVRHALEAMERFLLTHLVYS